MPPMCKQHWSSTTAWWIRLYKWLDMLAPLCHIQGLSRYHTKTCLGCWGIVCISSKITWKTVRGCIALLTLVFTRWICNMCSIQCFSLEGSFSLAFSPSQLVHTFFFSSLTSTRIFPEELLDCFSSTVCCYISSSEHEDISIIFCSVRASSYDEP